MIIKVIKQSSIYKLNNNPPFQTSNFSNKNYIYFTDKEPDIEKNTDKSIQNMNSLSLNILS